jgi:hypothetical protein
MAAVKVISALLAMLMAGLAAPSDPGATAVQFLEKVRTKKVNLDPGADTALSPQTSAKKRDEIARRLERLARDLGNDPLEVGAVKLDGELAAVLVRKLGGFDPSRLQVFPVALVKRGAGWAVAPVPASFENSGIGYAAALRQRLESLEEWMLRQRVFDLEALREESTVRMRQKVEENLPAATLRGFTSRQAGDRFLAACEQRKLPEALGLLGGLSADLPDDWQLRLRAADSAFATGSEVARPWRLLVAPEVLRVPVYHDEDLEGKSAILSIACLDPVGRPPQFRNAKVELVHLAISRTSEGYWRIDPGSQFLAGAGSSEDESDDDLDADLLDLFPAKLALQYPVSPGQTAEEARDALIKAFGDLHPSSWARLIRIQGDPSDRRDACARAAQQWWESRNPSSVRPILPLAFHEIEDRAVAACQFFDFANPERLNLKFLMFEKTPMGWLWDPVPSDDIRAGLRDWTDRQITDWQDRWQDVLLEDCPVVPEIAVSAAPSEEASRKVVESWLKATRAGDLSAALRLTARLNGAESKISLLRNLGFEFVGARLNQKPSPIIGVHRGKIFAAAGTRFELDGKASFPCYPVIETPSGPRVLLEVDLLAAGSRSRDFLNGEALRRLRNSSPQAADELKKLFTAHQAEVTKKDP